MRFTHVEVVKNLQKSLRLNSCLDLFSLTSAERRQREVVLKANHYSRSIPN